MANPAGVVSVADSHRTAATLGIVLVLTLGAVLRLIWPSDMEYKADEIYSFEKSVAAGVTEPWPWTGMNNSADVPHPGASVWVFIGLTRLTGAASPEELNFACMTLNVVALAALAVFIVSTVPPNAQEPWWWGLAILAVNPMAVLFHRKIWPPSVMPLFAVALLWAWWYRRRPAGSAAFGLIAIIAAQIHPGTFFFVAGIVLWTALLDAGSFWYRWLAAGFGVGSVPALPWIYHLLFLAPGSVASKARWWRPFEFRFWNYAFTEPIGLGLQYALGEDFTRFLSYPSVAGQPTFLVGGLHAVLVLAAAVFAIRFATAGWRRWGLDRSPTGLIVGAVVVAYGLLLTIGGLPVYRHYLIIAAPVLSTGLARAVMLCWPAVTARRMLVGLVATQAAVSALFLSYIHLADRPVRGDYGSPLRVQRQAAPTIAGRR
jgi:hypothetical protein